MNLSRRSSFNNNKIIQMNIIWIFCRLISHMFIALQILKSNQRNLLVALKRTLKGKRFESQSIQSIRKNVFYPWIFFGCFLFGFFSCSFFDFAFISISKLFNIVTDLDNGFDPCIRTGAIVNSIDKFNIKAKPIRLFVCFGCDSVVVENSSFDCHNQFDIRSWWMCFVFFCLFLP